MEVLLLTDKETAELLSIDKVMAEVELAFKEYALGYVDMPPKTYLNYIKYRGDLRTMPAYLQRLDASSVKIVSVHLDNPQKFGLPTVTATVLLIDPKNGQVLSIMGGTTITALRTGAAGGIAAKYLANKNSTTVGFLGAGVQSRSQLTALQTVFPKLTAIKTWDRSLSAAERFKAEINKAGKLEAATVETAKEAVVDADIVVTTTPSRVPIVLDSWVSEGTHFNCIGADAPGKEELEPKLLKRSKVVVDSLVQALHSGEINVPIRQGMLTKADVWGELGEIVAGSKAGRRSPREITVFDSTGLAIQDTVTANLAYREAIRRKIGRFITI